MAEERKGRIGPATAEAPPDAAAAAAETVEALAERLGTPAWVLAGAKVAYGWGAGKQMKEAEFQRAVNAWLNRPMGGDR